jgi:hypothetical protein
MICSCEEILLAPKQPKHFSRETEQNKAISPVNIFVIYSISNKNSHDALQFMS